MQTMESFKQNCMVQIFDTIQYYAKRNMTSEIQDLSVLGSTVLRDEWVAVSTHGSINQAHYDAAATYKLWLKNEGRGYWIVPVQVIGKRFILFVHRDYMP